MGQAGECTQTRHLLGVYLLGAIDPAGRSAVDSHLAGCAACRQELAGLAGLPALLSRVPASDVQFAAGDAAGPAGQLDRAPGPGLPELLTRAAAAGRARRWRAQALAAAGLAIAVGGGVALPQVWQPAGQPGAGLDGWRTVSGRSAQTQASATVDYASRGWGTALAVRVGRIPPGTTCQLWVTNARGQEAEAGGWTIPRATGPVWYPASTSYAATSLRRFEITAGQRTLVSILVHLPRAGLVSKR
jgi:anti-sigma factor RsiW